MPIPTDLLSSARTRAIAAQLAAALYQARVYNRRLLIALDPTAPSNGAELGQLIELAHAALPVAPARRPEDSSPGPAAAEQRVTPAVSDVQSVSQPPGATHDPEPNTLVVDAEGEPLASAPIEACFVDYAEAMLAEARTAPEWLAGAARRVARLLEAHARPSNDAIRLIPTLFRLEASLAAAVPGTTGLLRQALMPLARDPLPWQRLLDAVDWTAVDPNELAAFILMPSERLGPGTVALRAAAQAHLMASGKRLALRGPSWRRSVARADRERLQELLVETPETLPSSLLADLGRSLPLAEIPPEVLAPLLAAELEERTLWRRRFQNRALALAACAPGVLSILLQATDQGLLEPAWWRTLVTGEVCSATEATPALLAVLPLKPPWHADLTAVIERAARELTEPSADIAETASAALRMLDPQAHLDLALVLVQLIGKARHSSLPSVLEHLWPKLAALTEPAQQELVVERIAAGEDDEPLLSALIDDDGSLTLPWAGCVHLAALAERKGVAARIAPATLVRCLTARTTEEQAAQRIHALIDEQMRRQPEPLTRCLISTGRWEQWRRYTKLNDEERRQSALTWLSSPAWQSPPEAGNPQARAAEATTGNASTGPASCTRELWQLVDQDLPPTLSADDIRAICPGPQGRWPWDASTAPQALKDLAARCDDLGTLALLAECVIDRAAPAAPTTTELVAASRFAEQLSNPAAFDWLLAKGGEASEHNEPPSLTDSATLLQHAGIRRPHALAAHGKAVANLLARAPCDGVRALENWPWWTQGYLVRALRHHVDASMRDTSTSDWLVALEQVIGDLARDLPDPEQPCDAASRWVAVALCQRKLQGIARLFHNDAPALAARRERFTGVLQALEANDPDDQGWKELAQRCAESSASGPSGWIQDDHPLLQLAGVLEEALAAPEQPAWAENDRGFGLLKQILADYPALLTPAPFMAEQSLPILEVLPVLRSGAPLETATRELLDVPVVQTFLKGAKWRAAAASTFRRGTGTLSAHEQAARHACAALIENATHQA